MAQKKTVLLTGATGNMGGATLRELLQRSDRFRVKAFVLPREKDHRTLRRYAGHPGLEIVWGDLTNYQDVLRGVAGVEQVLHIGGMVSPLADRLPELTMAVNVGGARNLVAAIKAQPDPDRIELVYIGTVAQTGHRGPPIHWGRTGDPIKISRFDHYAVSKTQAEAIVAESGLKRWVSLRQTGIAHPNMWRIFDPIMFHSPFNAVLEWVSVDDAGRLAANICEDGVPSDVWRRFHNIGGGERMRVVNHEFASLMFGAMGVADFRTIVDADWFATGNFHGQWYSDSDKLERLIPFRRETMADVVSKLSRNVPLYVKAGARLAPGAARARIKRLATADGGPLHWLANDDQPHIDAYFGSREAWRAIPIWERYEFAQPSRVPSKLDHGYDEAKPPEAWTLADLRHAAKFRGGACVAVSEHEPYKPADWICARGHAFSMTPNLMLRGGHWCPTCMVDPDTYGEVAGRSPFFAQVWGEGR